ncbi:MAG: PEGA domain-containing protein [Magnetococcales bacterium]|nr:PEGA domain-containing protein [Magnetococcales bacterium]
MSDSRRFSEKKRLSRGAFLGKLRDQIGNLQGQDRAYWHLGFLVCYVFLAYLLCLYFFPGRADTTMGVLSVLLGLAGGHITTGSLRFKVGLVTLPFILIPFLPGKETPQIFSPAGKEAGLTIETYPAHSQVTIDGQFRGQTPGTFYLPTGEHRVILKGPHDLTHETIQRVQEKATVMVVDWTTQRDWPHSGGW